jgi:hypothetical protein
MDKREKMMGRCKLYDLEEQGISWKACGINTTYAKAIQNQEA